MSIPSQRAYDIKHAAHVEKYSKEIRSIYLSIINEASAMSAHMSLNADKQFFFKDNPTLNKKINKLISTLNTNVKSGTITAINNEWDLADGKHDELAEYATGKKAKDLPKQYRDRYFSTSASARKAFVSRKQSGLNLSNRVWRNSKQFKQELELGLEYGIGQGTSASKMARQVQRYLNNPDKLYKRVKDTTGTLRLSKNAKAYSPGKGVYRSSYKNALRLTRNETNFAYEAAQAERRERQDFIVGIEIRVSPAHKPGDDKGGISCLDLQGKYPKDFDWSQKWHVNCRCMSLNILKTKKELEADTEAILAGGSPSETSTKMITKYPNKKVIAGVKELTKNYAQQPKWLASVDKPVKAAQIAKEAAAI